VTSSQHDAPVAVNIGTWDCAFAKQYLVGGRLPHWRDASAEQ